ncbi:MAG: hypothetical protein ACREQ3_01220 [Candidatus Binatia bacterium]
MKPVFSPSPATSARESRCRCGNMLARLRPEGVELKCRRCKRMVVIPWGTPSTWHGVQVQWQEESAAEGTDLPRE